MVPSETPASMAPPDYETVTKSCPPPDYDLAMKYQTDLPPDFNSLSNTTVSEASVPKSETNNQATTVSATGAASTNQTNQQE